MLNGVKKKNRVTYAMLFVNITYTRPWFIQILSGFGTFLRLTTTPSVLSSSTVVVKFSDSLQYLFSYFHLESVTKFKGLVAVSYNCALAQYWDAAVLANHYKWNCIFNYFNWFIFTCGKVITNLYDRLIWNAFLYFYLVTRERSRCCAKSYSSSSWEGGQDNNCPDIPGTCLSEQAIPKDNTLWSEARKCVVWWGGSRKSDWFWA